MNDMFAVRIIGVQRAAFRIDHHDLLEAATRLSIRAEQIGVIATYQDGAAHLRRYRRRSARRSARVGNLTGTAGPRADEKANAR